MKAEVKLILNDANEVNMAAQLMQVLDNYRAATGQQKAKSEAIAAELTQESMTAQQVNEGPLVPPAPAATPSPDTVKQAISAFKVYAEKNGIPAARAVLDKVGVKRAGDITEAQVPALLEAIK